MEKKLSYIFIAAALVSYLAACQAPAQQPETTLPTIVQGTTVPETTLPETTVPETTVPETTEPETTEPTVPPETAPPVTLPPTTEAPTTIPPATEPATEAPTTVPPATEPATEAPTTVPPATEPVTEPPTTVPPTTAPPTTVPETEPPTTAAQDTVQLPEEAAIPNNITAVASGTKVKSNEYASIDYSNTQDGYVMVCYTAQTSSRLKAQVKGPATTYTYNLTPGSWSAFPLSDENGDYQISVFENVVDSKYAVVLSATITVSMDDEFAPFLRSNQYVNFDNAPNTVAKAAALAGGISDPLQKVEKIYDFVVGNMTYDTALASSVQSGYVPNLDSVLSKMTGICFDYAALMTGMLRSQGVPAKLVIGYAGDAYHAWINVWSESTGWVDGVIWFDGVNWKRMDPTFASSGGSGMLEYIGDGTNYTAKYFY